MKPTASDRRRVFALALPASLEAGTQTLLGAVDTLMVGRLGDAAAGGVGLSNHLIFLTLLTLGTIGAGGAVLVAQHHGAGDADRASRVGGQIMAAGALAGLVLACAFALFADDALRLMGAGPGVTKAGASYLAIVAAGMPFALLAVLGGETLRSVGEARGPFYVAAASVVLNTALNYVLIFGSGPVPALGVEGAAIATLISRILAGGALLWLVFSARRPGRFRLQDALRLDPPILKDVAKIAWPVTLGEGAWSAGMAFYAALFAAAGAPALVASQVAQSVNAFFVMTAFGLSTAGLALVGQALGRRDPGEAQATGRAALELGLGLGLGGALLTAALAPFLTTLYPELSAAALDLTYWGLILFALILPVQILNMILGNGVLRGGGDARFVLLGDLGVVWGVGATVALIFGLYLGYGFFGVLAGKLAEEAARVVLFGARFLSGKWARTLTASSATA